MLYIIKFLYTIFMLPPGILIVLLILYSIYLYRKKNKAYRGTALFVIVLYLCSISLIGDYAINKLETQHAFPSGIKGDVIVMLGGGALGDTLSLNGEGTLSGSSASRILACAELYNKLHVPVIISGGQVYNYSGNEAEISRRILLNLGAKNNDIIIDNKSLNTEQNAVNTAKILKANGFSRPILVTSAFHMERSVLQFQRNKVQVLPYPCDYRTNLNKTITIGSFVPQSDALNNLSTAIKEYIGILQVKILNR